VVAASSGASTMLDLKAEPMLEGNYEPLFKLEHMLKDVRHYLDAARGRGLSTALSSAAEKLYTQADHKGLGGEDFAAVMTAAEDDSSAQST
jgi:2-hydroxy-3-oxopropionate reductase